jgi:hypothetical protein
MKSIDASSCPIIIPGAPTREMVCPNVDDYLDYIKRFPKLAGGQTARPVAPAIPFIASAHEHGETFPVVTKDYSVSEAEETVEFNVPSYGYIRAIWLDVSMPAQKGATAVENIDAPFATLGAVTFLDTNGAPIFGPLSGFNTFLTNLYGGYVYQQDPRTLPNFLAFEKSGKFRFQVRIPIEISHHDGTGCIGNQNASAPYRIRLTMNKGESAGGEALYKTKPEAFEAGHKLEVKPILEAWSLPNAQDALGRPQAQLPPNYGTVQYWSERVQSAVGTGLNNVQVLRVGNLIRNLIFVGRATSATGAREDGISPEFPIVNWDARQLYNETLSYRQTRSFEPLESIGRNVALKSGEGVGNGRPTGVFAYTFDRTNQDRAGDDKPWLWLPTVEATRLEWTGNWEKAGVQIILTNDVAPAEVNPTQRYALPSATGFHPSAEVPNPNQP